jgi:hypothetical protein
MSKTSWWGIGSLLLVVFCFIATTNGRDETPTMPVIHPKVFELVESWLSDTEHPVVTEVNLDAAATNRNQFDRSTIKNNGEWIEYTDNENHGFKRFKALKTSNGRFAVEFQSNEGGTLTTALVIEFTIEKREIQNDGKPASVRVLRVAAIAAKS